MLGTNWVHPGSGATVAELLKAHRHTTHCPKPLRKQAKVKLAVLSIMRGREYSTNLALTGAVLADYDLERIAQCR